MRIKRKPNLHLRKIVLEETNEGRDIVRYLKSVITTIEGAPEQYGLRHKDYARSHKIAAARILAKLGFEEGEYYLGRNYVQAPFKRVHPEEEDGPKRDMAASTAQLYRLVKAKTRDGADIMVHFVEIMKGYHPEYKPHLRMAAAKELVRQIEFDYEEEPTPPAPTHTESAPVSEPVGASLVGARASSESDQRQPDPVHPEYPVNPRRGSPLGNPDSDKITAHHQNHTNHSSDDNPHPDNPVHPTHPENPDSDKITAHHQNQTNHSSDEPSLAEIQRRMHVEDGSVHYRDYAAQHAREAESIYQSIIRRASGSYDLDEAQRKTQDLIAEFDDFMAERDPDYQPIAVPDNLITKSLTDRMRDHENWIYDPADYYDLDQDYFYYCMCLTCEACDELHYFLEFMRELEEETDHLLEDP